MNAEKLIEHFTRELKYREKERDMVIASIRKMPVPDIVARRVCETKCLMLRCVIMDIKRLEEEEE